MRTLWYFGELYPCEYTEISVAFAIFVNQFIYLDVFFGRITALSIGITGAAW